MFWKKLLKKKKIIPPKIIERKTLEEVSLDGVLGDIYYFRLEMGLKEKELVLYAKTPIGYNTTKYKLPLRCIDITKISTRVGGNKDFWERLMIEALKRHWRKYER